MEIGGLESVEKSFSRGNQHNQKYYTASQANRLVLLASKPEGALLRDTFSIDSEPLITI